MQLSIDFVPVTDDFIVLGRVRYKRGRLRLEVLTAKCPMTERMAEVPMLETFCSKLFTEKQALYESSTRKNKEPEMITGTLSEVNPARSLISTYTKRELSDLIFGYQPRKRTDRSLMSTRWTVCRTGMASLRPGLSLAGLEPNISLHPSVPCSMTVMNVLAGVGTRPTTSLGLRASRVMGLRTTVRESMSIMRVNSGESCGVDDIDDR